MCEGVKVNSSTEALSILELYPADLCTLVEALKWNTSVRKLHLSFRKTTTYGDVEIDVDPLGESLKYNTTLMSLYVEGMKGRRHFSNAPILTTFTLMDGLINNNTLTTLSLRHCNLGYQGGIDGLFLSLSHNTTLTSLDLMGNGISSIDCLCSCLEDNTTLRELYLGDNRIESLGNLPIVLRDNEVLTSLSLKGNGKINGKKRLARSLRENVSLTSLDMRGTRIKDPCMWLKSMKHNTTLASLSVGYGYGTHHTLELIEDDIADVLNVSSTLTHLDIREYEVSYGGYTDDCTNVLKANTTMRRLYLHKYAMYYHDVVNVLSYNTSLEDLGDSYMEDPTIKSRLETNRSNRLLKESTLFYLLLFRLEE